MLLDQTDVQAGGRPGQGRRISGWASSHHDKVVLNERRATKRRYLWTGHEATTTWTAKAARRAIPQSRELMISIRVLILTRLSIHTYNPPTLTAEWHV